jgi:hypothetical protein
VTTAVDKAAAEMGYAAAAWEEIVNMPFDDMDIDNLPDPLRRVLTRQRTDAEPAVTKFNSFAQ